MTLWDMSKYKGVTSDSRDVKPGYLFVAIQGTGVNGEDYIPQAIENGAMAIVVAHESYISDVPAAIQLLRHENPRLALAQAAAAFYNHDQPPTMMGVTGTNGKTSVAWFAQQLWGYLGYKATSIGTLGVQGAVTMQGGMTTPDPVNLHHILHDLKGQGVTHAVMECSSHGLHQYRQDGISFQGACFTNLTRDHLDYHLHMQDYFEAKKRLFSEVIEKDSYAVVFDDGEWNERLIEWASSSQLTLIRYGSDQADIALKTLRPTPHGTQAKISVFGQPVSLSTSLIGAFQIDNLMGALGLVLAPLDDDARSEAMAQIASHIDKIKGVPGRLEVVSGHPEGAGVAVDYAHTPEALETVLTAVRPHAQNRLICVFGCGGDRDAGKRPLMAAAVKNHADIGILTDDNPRGEDPSEIRRQAKQGFPEVEEIDDRETAIAHALKMAQSGDLVIIAGKGHEQGQEVKGIIHPFDDRDVTRRILNDMKGVS